MIGLVISGLVQGILTGLMLAFLTVGMTLIYRISRLTNFAHGSLFVVAMYLTFALSRSIDIDPQTGGNIDMPLPDAALPGGYQLRLQLDGTVYTAEFRVAHYAKPHFQVDIALDQPHYHPGDTIRGSVKLHYPDGKPVQHAKVLLDIKAQALSATDNDAHTRFIRQLREQSLERLRQQKH